MTAARLVLADAPSAQDALTFARRSARIGDEGVRLQAAGGVLAMSTAALAPRGLLDRTPTVLGMRIIAADPELQCDLVVSELAETDDDTALALPETALAPAWAGVAPPRGGWEPRGEISAATLASRAQWGIAAVAERMPKDAGEDVVRAIRGDVWGMPDDALLGLPLGIAFAAFSLGFIGGEEEARVTASGRWTRVTLQRGHILSRGPAAMGMTAVRETGSR
ncbi:hypothetical protein E4U02_00730 [Microbacterium paludicola]|uniref:Uncharacterized protein n=1 Tax=Microbacterium paludicola TaxID=300019 RepID=A0A4Y9G0J2_9MICO|nr:hypothetical protein [Microbacterium paludicola]MBF0814935.1 hypothetical protein [Microbacterium paludicola]TFU34662.1 hypothetical protein E4U02_00730 [Microbacterium paludicola]